MAASSFFIPATISTLLLPGKKDGFVLYAPVGAALAAPLTGQIWPRSNGAGAGAPTGTAGGDLTGTYPNPAIAAGVIVDADVSASAAIATSKIAGLDTALLGKTPTSRQMIAGAGLTGGGDLTADRTLNIGAGAGITVAADTITVDPAWVAATADLQDRWGGSVTTTTVANLGYVAIANLTATTARGISQSAGSFVASRSGVYVVTLTLLCTTAPADGTCFLDIVHYYDAVPNARTYRAKNIGSYFTVTGSWWMDTYKSFYFAVGNNSGASISVSGAINVVRVSEV